MYLVAGRGVRQTTPLLFLLKGRQPYEGPAFIFAFRVEKDCENTAGEIISVIGREGGGHLEFYANFLIPSFRSSQGFCDFYFFFLSLSFFLSLILFLSEIGDKVVEQRVFFLFSRIEDFFPLRFSKHGVKRNVISLASHK